MTANPAPIETDFGFRRVPAAAKAGLVRQVFASVAPRYDLMNDLMSGGLHRLWKADMIAWLNPPRSGSRPFTVLDVAGGTGDIAIRVAKATREMPWAHVTVCDISPEMLEVGRRRIEAAGLSSRITCIEGNAEALPFPDQSFDAYTIAFGIRNVTHIDTA
ncbi:MAG: class I SAM-dependent methyltransferase, partial [Rhodospirillales bacterium]|nr:class I SAM-dependent methyltransferase [Rhodospirillales bacterium]